MTDLGTNAGRCSRKELWHQLANAINLVAKQDQISWTVFGIFWAANALLLGSLATREVGPNRSTAILVALAGVLTCSVWSVIQKRAVDFKSFYDAVIHRLEAQLLGGNLDVALSGRLNDKLLHTHVRGLGARSLMKLCPFLALVAWLVALKYFVFFFS